MTEVPDALYTRIRRHIVPMLFLGYMFAILDRGNSAMAALTMNKDIGLSASAFGLAGAMFFLGYLSFELPSNLLLQRYGARLWIARIMVTWGLVTIATAFCTGPITFAASRLILGFSEAGFLPGVLLYFTYWFPPEQRSKATADFLLSIPLVSAGGALIAGLFLSMNVAGLKGWQWLFLIEGVPPILLAGWIFAKLPDGPAQAHFLGTEEKAAVIGALGTASASRLQLGASLGRAIGSPRIWTLGLINLGFISCNYVISTWLPQIIKSYGFSVSHVGLVVALPQFAGAVAILGWPRVPPRLRSGALAFVVPLAVALAAMLFGTGSLGSPFVAITSFIVAVGALYAVIPAFWVVASRSLAPTDAAAGLALISTIGSISGVIGPPAVGILKDRTHSFAAGFYFASALVVASLLLTIAYFAVDRIRTKQMSGAETASV